MPEYHYVNTSWNNSHDQLEGSVAPASGCHQMIPADLPPGTRGTLSRFRLAALTMIRSTQCLILVQPDAKLFVRSSPGRIKTPPILLPRFSARLKPAKPGRRPAPPPTPSCLCISHPTSADATLKSLQALLAYLFTSFHLSNLPGIHNASSSLVH